MEQELGRSPCSRNRGFYKGVFSKQEYLSVVIHTKKIDFQLHWHIVSPLNGRKKKVSPSGFELGRLRSGSRCATNFTMEDCDSQTAPGTLFPEQSPCHGRTLPRVDSARSTFLG